jgi:hypothetical protein
MTRKEYSSAVEIRNAVISENRSRRMRIGYLVDTKAGDYLGFVRCEDLAEARAEVAEFHNPDDCVFTRQESF